MNPFPQQPYKHNYFFVLSYHHISYSAIFFSFKVSNSSWQKNRAYGTTKKSIRECGTTKNSSEISHFVETKFSVRKDRITDLMSIISVSLEVIELA